MNFLPGLFSFISTTFIREWVIGVRNRSDLANPLIFFLTVVVFVPLGISPDPKVLMSLAPGMVWIIALLATLLSLDRMFQSDFEDGSLDQMLVSGQPLYWFALIKAVVHWLLTGLPLTILAPVMGLMMNLAPQGYIALIVSLLLGSACLSLIGAIGAALTVALRRGGLLLSLIIMPLYVPILIFGTSAVRNAAEGDPFWGQITMLLGFLMGALVLSPIAVAGALRVSADN